MSAYDNAYYLRLLRLLLLPSGIVIQPEYKKYRTPYVVLFLCFTCTGLCGIITALFIPNASRMQIMETVYALNAGLNSIEIFIVQQIVRKSLLDLYEDVQWHYLKDSSFAETTDKLAIRMMSKKWILLCIYIWVSVPPLIIISTTNISIEDMRALSFPLVCPWKINSMLKYLITLGIEVTAITIAVMLLFAGVGIVFCFIFAIRSHTEILKKDLDECFHSTTSSSMIKGKLISIVKKHQHLMRFTAKVVDISSYIVQMATLVFMVSCVMLTSIFILAPNEYWNNLKMICSSANVTLAFFWCCYIGDELSNLTNEIKQKIYEIQWYNQDVEIQKIILHFMNQNRKQFRLKIFNMYWINLNFFQNVLRNCYSMIQLLLKA